MAASARVLPASLLVAALLAGCGVAGDDGAPETSAVTRAGTPTPVDPTAAPGDDAAAAAEPGVDPVRAGGTAVAVDGPTVLHVAPTDAAAAVTTQRDGDVVVVTVAPVTAATGAELLLAAPTGAGVSLQDDGSLLTLGPDGTFLGGVARPGTVPDGGRVTVEAAGEGVVRVSASAGTVRLRVADRALAATDWGEREGGRSLAVTPTPWARTAGQAGEVGVWTQLVVAVPDVDTPVMRDQLTCHAFGAPDKETWNLEPWRPDVGLLAVLAAACNPT